MARGFNGVVEYRLRTLFEVGAVGSMTDGELLDRFLEDREHSGQAAFEVLVDRHGPMVYSVCRGLLKTSHDREDAFQATFLLLAGRARSIRNRDSIGPWLFGVARRVSARARGNASRRFREQSSVAPEQRPGPPERSGSGEFEELVSEVDRLPDRLRSPIVLCYWQGLTYDESAEVLGLTEGAIRGRLARARELLRSRLARKGITPETMVSAMFALRSPQAVPIRLIEPTIRASARVAASQSCSGIVSASVVSLTQGAWSMLLTTKWASTAALLLTVLVVIGFGPGVLARQKKTGDRSLIAQPAPIGQAPSKQVADEDASLTSLVDGKILRSAEVTKDCMVLSYLPDWGHGNVDNIGFEGHDGGVRTLVNWPDVPPAEAGSNPLRFYLAFYARKSIDKSKPGSIVALEISGDWPEATSWRTRPYAEAETVGTYKFEPGDGWKVFEITQYVRAKEGRAGHGLMFRYINEDRPGAGDWTGYQIVSREGEDRWAKKRPRLLVVDSSKK